MAYVETRSRAEKIHFSKKWREWTMKIRPVSGLYTVNYGGEAALVAMKPNKSHEAVHCPNKQARECQWSRKRFFGRAENALYSYRLCMTNLWTSTKQRWSIVCRNSWMAVSPQEKPETKETQKWGLILPFKGHVYFDFKLEMLLIPRESIGTFTRSICIRSLFLEGFPYMPGRPRHRRETCKAIS